MRKDCSETEAPTAHIKDKKKRETEEDLSTRFSKWMADQRLIVKTNVTNTYKVYGVVENRDQLHPEGTRYVQEEYENFPENNTC